MFQVIYLIYKITYNFIIQVIFKNLIFKVISIYYNFQVIFKNQKIKITIKYFIIMAIFKNHKHQVIFKYHKSLAIIKNPNFYSNLLKFKVYFLSTIQIFFLFIFPKVHYHKQLYYFNYQKYFLNMYLLSSDYNINYFNLFMDFKVLLD